MRKKLPKILVTGGAGFIGSEFVRQGVLKGYPLVVVDKLTYAGDLKRLDEVKKWFKFYKTDVCSVLGMGSIFKKEKPGIVVHFAAESHVDRSIQDASPFIKTNIQGTQVLLDISREYGVERFVHISTDEIYGDIIKGLFKEASPLHPNSPYAASKASADLFIKAAARTHVFPAIIVRPSNNYGPWQYPEKLIPVVILKAQEGQKVPVYSRGENVREWLYVSDCVRAVFLVMERGKTGEIYNVGSGQEKKNIETVKRILEVLGKGPDMISFVKDRPGHDFRYAMDCSKIRALGWRPRVNFDEGLKQTVSWNLENFSWLSGKLRSLKAYWKKVY